MIWDYNHPTFVDVEGAEYSGVIEELGKGTEKLGFKVGDRVFGLSSGTGSFSEQADLQAQVKPRPML